MPNSFNQISVHPLETPVTLSHFEGFMDSLPDVNNYTNGAVICYNNRVYTRMDSQWILLNSPISMVSTDFKPVWVTDNLEIVRNDAHFKTLLNNILIDLGVINAC